LQCVSADTFLKAACYAN